MSLPLFINDPRYILLSSIKDRKEVFDEFCRDKARELRAAKLAGAAAGGSAAVEKKDPEREFKDLLKAEVKSTRMRFEDFKKSWKKDRRYFGWGRDDREREKTFKTYQKELGERECRVLVLVSSLRARADSLRFSSTGKRADAKRAESDFYELLGETDGITSESIWKEVRLRISLPLNLSPSLLPDLPSLLSSLRPNVPSTVTLATKLSAPPPSEKNSSNPTSSVSPPPPKPPPRTKPLAKLARRRNEPKLLFESDRRRFELSRVELRTISDEVGEWLGGRKQRGSLELCWWIR